VPGGEIKMTKESIHIRCPHFKSDVKRHKLSNDIKFENCHIVGKHKKLNIYVSQEDNFVKAVLSAKRKK